MSIKCLLNYHAWKYVDGSFKPTGYVTLDWGMGSTREYEKQFACTRCGKTQIRPSYVCVKDRERNPDVYDADGFPLNPDGTRMNLR